MSWASLLHWVHERESIRLKREEGARAPWTRDPILSTFRFCNVRRRDDRVSRWIIHNIIERYKGHPNLWVMVALARYVNWPDTLQEIMDAGLWPVTFNPQWKAIGECIDARTASGKQSWTGAYMIRAESNPDAPWYTYGKGRYVTQIVIKRELWANKNDITMYLGTGSTVEEVHKAIAGRYGWGSFMAGQVVADYTYCSLLDDAPDLYTWAPLGPGSRRGLNRLHGRPVDAPLSQEQAVEEMREARFQILMELGAEYDDMTLHDVQNCLCETDKYLRVQSGEGRPRSKFTPHKE